MKNIWSRAGGASKPVTEDDLQNLKDADIEDIGSHRYSLKVIL